MDDRATHGTLRERAGQAYDEELRRALVPVAEAFQCWKLRTAPSVEISGQIHEFYEGPQREPRGTYQTLEPDGLVVRAVAPGILAKESLPRDVAASLAGAIETFKPSLRDEDWVRIHATIWAEVARQEGTMVIWVLTSSYAVGRAAPQRSWL
jgi:hypothetical protein